MRAFTLKEKRRTYIDMNGVYILTYRKYVYLYLSVGKDQRTSPTLKIQKHTISSLCWKYSTLIHVHHLRLSMSFLCDRTYSIVYICRKRPIWESDITSFDWSFHETALFLGLNCFVKIILI